MSWRFLLASSLSGSAMTLGCCKVAGLFDAAADAGTTSASKNDPKYKTCQDKFTFFATTIKNNERLMSVADLIASLSPAHRQGAADQATSEKSDATVQSLFAKFDLSGDGSVSYSEYCTLMTLLSVPSTTLRKAFLLRCDSNNNGSLTPKQLKKVILSLTADPTIAIDDAATSALVGHILGTTEGRQSVSLEQLSDFVDGMERDIVTAVFHRVDSRNRGRLPLRVFRRLVLQQTDQGTQQNHDGPTPQDVQGAARYLAEKGDDPSADKRPSDDSGVSDAVAPTDDDPQPDQKWWKRSGRSRRSRSRGSSGARDGAQASGYSNDDLLNVLRVLKDAEQWLQPLRWYTRGPEEVVASNTIDKRALYRAFIAAKMGNVSPRVSNAVFDVFDVDGSGTLSVEEIETVTSSHASWFATQRAEFDEPERNWIQRFAKCMQQR